MSRCFWNVPIGFVALSLFTFQPALAQNYSDNFEASNFNRFWTTASQTGGTVSLCTGENHTPGGHQSACFSAQGSGQKYLSLQHQFASAIQGSFSVWFYDSGEVYADQTYYNYLELSAIGGIQTAAPQFSGLARPRGLVSGERSGATKRADRQFSERVAIRKWIAIQHGHHRDSIARGLQ